LAMLAHLVCAALAMGLAVEDPKSTQVNGMKQKLDTFEAKLKESALSHDELASARANVKVIRSDLERVMVEKDTTKRAGLVSDLQSRVHKLHETRDLIAEHELERSQHAKASDLARTEADVEKIEAKVKQLQIDSGDKSKIMSNLEAMKHDISRLKQHGNEEEHSRLLRALNLRMQALREREKSALTEAGMSLEKVAPAPKAEAAAAPLSTASVTRDLERVLTGVRGAGFDKKMASGIEENLVSIKEDMSKLAIVSAGDKTRLQKAISLRAHALRSQMEAASRDKTLSLERETVRKEKSALADLEAVAHSIKQSTTMASAVKASAHKNLEAIKDDVKRLDVTSGDKQERLKQALKLRMQALKSQLTKHN